MINRLYNAAPWVLLLLVVLPMASHAEMWECQMADGSVLFKDGGGAGCREVNALPELQSTRLPSGRGMVDFQSRPEPSNRISPALKKTAELLSSRRFEPASRAIPNLYFKQMSPGLAAKGWNRPNKGDVAMVQIDVGHWPAGDGPYLETDHHFKNWSKQAFAVAVFAAAKAVKYDPRYVRAYLTMPVGSILHMGDRVDGPSAGLAQSIAVASALLGDPLRTDICLSGTIDINMAVGPVGGLEDKIDGCHMLPNIHEMLLPAGQNTFAITNKGMARSLKVTEVSTLAEAYEIMTGRPLRPVPVGDR